jgi:4-amino-4-deoxy-L-arabinose transferase-like glycosyltransferase
MDSQVGDHSETAFFSRSPMAFAVLVHALIWSIIPALIVGGLHQDVLEAAYWGNDFALSYSRHPPLPSWLIDAVLLIGHAPIFSLLAMSQLGMAIAAAFVWRTARMFGGPDTAALAAMLLLISLAASFFAVQVNHNSLLAPFWAASLFYGLSYLENRKFADAALFGAATGFGMLVKYEMAAPVICLFFIALIVPRYRPAIFRPATVAAVIIAMVILSPHLFWLWTRDDGAVTYALGTHKVTDVASFMTSGGNLLVGQFILFVFPAVILFVLTRTGAVALRRPIWSDDKARVGAILAFGPSLALLAGLLATGQIAKPLWVLPFTSSCALGLSLLFLRDADFSAQANVIARRSWQGSIVLLAAFIAYLFIADLVGAAIGRPLTFFAADTKKLGEAVENFWKSRANGPLECVVIADDVLAASTVLWLRSRPHYVDFDQPSWSRPFNIERCRRSGGIVILTGAPHEKYLFAALPSVASAPRLSLVVPAAFGFSHVTWPVELAFLAPEPARKTER